MTGITRSSDGLDVRRRKLLFRAWHRGMREMDLILGRFAEDSIEQMSEAELAEFERLLDIPDDQVLAWLTGERVVPIAQDGPLLQRLRAFRAHRLEK